MNKQLVLIFVCLISTVCGNISFFNFGGFSQGDIDISIRDSKDSQCQWFNSGILGFHVDRVNATTTCRCVTLGVKECRTLHKLRNPTTDESSSAAPGKGIATESSSVTTGAPASG